MEEVILGLLTESDMVALTCMAPNTAPWMLFVTLGLLVWLFSKEVLVRLAVGTAGNAGHPGCQKVRVFCTLVCPDVGVFGVFSTLLFFDSCCGVSGMMRIAGCED